MSNKTIIPIIILVALIFGGGGFYGGIIYSKSKSPNASAQSNFQNLQNLSPEERQQRFQQAGANGGAFRIGRNGAQNGGFASGEIISKDDKSITVKMRTPGLNSNVNSGEQGSSKIVFYSDSTAVDKTVSSTVSDLEIGKIVTINGSANSDGSITAQSIQLRLLPLNQNSSQ